MEPVILVLKFTGSSLVTQKRKLLYGAIKSHQTREPRLLKNTKIFNFENVSFSSYR